MSTIRGIAALVVAFVHAFQIFCLPYFGLYGFPHLFTSFLASYAVIFFFVVSGFMIFISIENHTDDSGRFNVPSFFKARFLRIYPPLALSLLLGVVIYYAMVFFNVHGVDSYRLGGELFVSREKIQIEWSRFPSTFFLLYNVVPFSAPPLSINGPLWTLSYEWWFYLFAMFAVSARRGKSVKYAYLPLLFIILIFAVSPGGYLLRVLLLIWLAGFFLGYLYTRDWLLHRLCPRFALGFMLLCIAGMALAGREKTVVYFIEPLQRHGNTGHLIMMFTAFIITAILGLLIRRQVNPKILLSTADYSYTLYVVHFPLQLLVFGLLHQSLHGLSWWVSLIVGFLVTLVITQIAAQLARVVENKALLNSAMQRLVR